ncbi:hypothetical protein CMUS01_16485 [Colletotrichum musicola]|uniref:Uncharacterized protein n=1 Tax=Colletotrichum musicola TaxID=2175873 RepID=A0A8H6IMS3_9PEZI|nr:hypothetical protein CMUS01_16485 [Colletotrichum musicola]
MQLSTVLLAVVACATGAVADLHTMAWCVTKGLSISSGKNLQATRDACDYYRRNRFGNEWWDSCPDCIMETNANGPSALVCWSPAEHIGGDQWQDLCIHFGAGDGGAN